jgi:hypothetical protein
MLTSLFLEFMTSEGNFGQTIGHNVCSRKFGEESCLFTSQGSITSQKTGMLPAVEQNVVDRTCIKKGRNVYKILFEDPKTILEA